MGVTNYTQYWGNYTLLGGTSVRAGPLAGGYGGTVTSGYGPPGSEFTYVTGGLYLDGDADHIQAVLGSNWNLLRAGDVVKVKLTHIPSGKVIYDSDVAVEG